MVEMKKEVTMDKKKRFNACLSILITSLLVISSTTTFAQEKKPIRVVVFGWDGTQRSDLIDILQDETDRSSEQWQDINITTAEQLYEAAVQNLQGKLLADSSFLIKKDLPKKDFLPTLRKIIEQGRIVKIHISENTATKPGWTQILTGYNADITGVYKNTPGYYTAFPRGYSIFGRLADTFGPDNIYNIMVTGKDKHIGTKELSANNILPFYNEVIVDKKKNYYNYFIMYSGKYVFAAENGEYIKISSIKARAINREVLKLKSKNLEFLIDIKNFNLEEYCLELNN